MQDGSNRHADAEGQMINYVERHTTMDVFRTWAGLVPPKSQRGGVQKNPLGGDTKRFRTISNFHTDPRLTYNFPGLEAELRLWCAAVAAGEDGELPTGFVGLAAGCGDEIRVKTTAFLTHDTPYAQASPILRCYNTCFGHPTTQHPNVAIGCGSGEVSILEGYGMVSALCGWLIF